MHPDAFSRARRFLHYQRWSAWGAVLAALLSTIPLVFLLTLFGLFVDLVVEKGAVHDPAAKADAWLGSRFGPDDARDLHDAIADGHGVGLVSLAWRLREHDSWLAEPVAGIAGAWRWTQRNGSYLTGLLVLALLTSVLWSLLQLGMHHWATRAVLEAAVRLRRAVYHQSFRLGTLAFRALGISESVGIFTRHLEAVAEGLYYWLTLHFRLIVQAALFVIFAFVLETAASGGVPWLSISALFFVILIWLVGGQLAAYARRQERRNAALAGEQLALLQESLQMLRLVKTYLMETFNQARMERQLARYVATQLRRHRDRTLTRQALGLIGLIAVAVILYAAGWNVLTGNLSTAATLTVMLSLVSALWPAYRWIDAQRYLRRGRESADKLFHFLDRSGEVGQVVGAEFLPPLAKQVEFDAVTLEEPGTKRILLDHVSLQIPAGQRVALVGSDELEKHALVYLIPRFLDPKKGEIRIDGKNVRWVTLESLRVQVALVLQHHYVFNDSVLHNIGCGDPGYTLPQIMEAAKVAHAHSFIQKLPNGYETRIGELGHVLSTGEQFRIALARAILRDPALVVIEEPAQALDEETKAMLDDTYVRFLPERTTIFLPHRLSTIKACDQVFLLDNGRIAAAGPHRDLVTSNELYRHLQYLEFNVFAERDGMKGET